MPFGAIHPHHTPHVYGGAHFAAPHGRDAPHAADHRRRRLRERKVWRSRTPKYPSADRQRARGRRCERNRDVCRHAPVATDTSGRVCDWRARRRREAVPEGTVAVRVSTHDTSIAQRFACKNSFFSVFSNCLPIVKLASDASHPTGSPKKNVRLVRRSRFLRSKYRKSVRGRDISRRFLSLSFHRKLLHDPSRSRSARPPHHWTSPLLERDEVRVLQVQQLRARGVLHADGLDERRALRPQRRVVGEVRQPKHRLGAVQHGERGV